MSLHEIRRWKRSGFTLMELLMAMVIAIIVMGSAVTLLRHGVLLMASNVAYTAAQRGALSSLELLSDEISTAGEVEIISDDTNHKNKIEAALADGWRYIVLSADNKVHYIGTSMNEVPGSEYIEAISFDTEVITDGGGRLLRVFVEAAYGSAGDVKTVKLNRTILVHAAKGVRGEDGAAFQDSSSEEGSSSMALGEPTGGHILRYRERAPEELPPGLHVYGSTNTGSVSAGSDIFNYGTPDTWGALSNFDYFTELDARLTPPSGSEPDNVIFTWIAADETIFNHDILNSTDAVENSEVILNYLKVHVDGLNNKEPWNVLNVTGEIELPEELTADPFNMNGSGNAKGFRLLAVTSGKRNERNGGFYEVAPNPINDRKYSLDILADLYKGSYMFVVASFREQESHPWTMLPVYVKLGERKKEEEERTTWFDDIIDELAGGTAITTTGDRTFENAAGSAGTPQVIQDQQTGRFYLRATAGGDSVPKIMLKLASKDFAHMIQEDATPIYGVTNYAIYTDFEIPGVNAGGGFGVLLNGSSIDIVPATTSGTWPYTTTPAEYRSGGYIFHYAINSNGLLFRYFGYPNANTYGEYKGTDSYGVEWGARPMYFYDATKGSYPAPYGDVSFWNGTGILTEDFSENAGIAKNAEEAQKRLNYRLPFSASTRDYINQITGNDFLVNKDINDMEGRNDRSVRTNNENNYGMMYGNNSPTGDNNFRSVYSPKHMQSWHRYHDTKISDMLGTEQDTRIGFRWDRSWYRDTSQSNNTQTALWAQRQILKLTILEVTRDITADEVESEWRYKIHHHWNANENPIANNNTLVPTDENEVIHKAGDIFVRAELIHLKRKDTNDWHNSRYYVYSKPIWFGKFKGDAWRGDDPSPFKKLGNTMQHIVADAEPRRGDAQSFRRRGMRVRSWKEAFEGWDFSTLVKGDVAKGDADDYYYYQRKKFVGTSDELPPDFYETVYGENGQVNTSETEAAHSVWTPPIAINLNLNVNGITQSGNNTANTFGQYAYTNQNSVVRVTKDGSTAYDGTYGSNIYGRLSILRPWRDTLPNQTTPIFGLYATRGWDYGNSGNGNVVYDDTGNSSKRFLRVVQGLQLPYRPTGATNRERNSSQYTADRDRIIGFRFWGSSTINLYDAWIGEGFSLREVRAILGLRERNEGEDEDEDEDEDEYKEFIRETYVGPALEAKGFYMPEGADE